MNAFVFTAALVALAPGLVNPVAAQNTTDHNVLASFEQVLPSFEHPPQKPNFGGLVLGPDGFFWGVTKYGGTFSSVGDSPGGGTGLGTIYRIKADGSGRETVVSFAGNSLVNRGGNPSGGLVSDGAGFLWGTTGAGYSSGGGTIFKLNLNTRELTTVVQFGRTAGGQIIKGYDPYGELVSDGAGFFWGTTLGGAGNGTVFKLNVTTGAVTTIAEFTDLVAVPRGRQPMGGLVNDGFGFFWGTTSAGGTGGFGTIFKIDTATGAFTTVLEFTGTEGLSRGSRPYGTLVGDGSGYLWGTTAGGGTSSLGTVFKIQVSSGRLTTVVDLRSDASEPLAGLVSDGAGSLWGTTSRGGYGNVGTVFKVNATSGAFKVVAPVTTLANLNDLIVDGYPRAPLVSDGAGSFLGTTTCGRAGYGSIFKVNAQTGVLITLAELGVTTGRSPQSALVWGADRYLWGTTVNGGIGDNGTIFKLNGNNQLTTVVQFTGKEPGNKGAHPYAELVNDGAGFFWGTTSDGGARGYGTVFKIHEKTGVLATVFEFASSGINNKGELPYAGLASDGVGYLWGTTSAGGSQRRGSLFKVETSTGVLTTILEFTGLGGNNRGQAPYATLMNDGAGFFWGTTSTGGTFNFGTIFKVSSTTAELTTVYDFTGATGARPTGKLVMDATGFIWGTTEAGGTRNSGTIFKWHMASGEHSTVANFGGTDPNTGAQPAAGLVADDAGAFWGTTRGPNHGTIFKVDSVTGELTTMFRLTGMGPQRPVGSHPSYGSLLFSEQGSFWGTTADGGPGGGGTIYQIELADLPPGVTTQRAEAITRTGATLHALASSGRTSTSVEFFLDSQSVGTRDLAAHTNALQKVNLPVGNLRPHTTYLVTTKATNQMETATGRETTPVSFTTLNGAPLAYPIELETFEDTPVALSLIGGDIDKDPVTYSIASAPSHGTVSGSGRDLTYTPATHYSGPDSFTYTVSDDIETSAPATVTLAVTRVVDRLVVASTGVPAPGAGEPDGPPAGTVLSRFGVPAISDSASLAAKVTLSAGSVKLGGIFQENGAGVGTLSAFQGGTAPGVSGTNVSFKRFRDPLLAPGGAVAFAATLRGVPAAEDEGVWTNAFSSASDALELVLRKGAPVPGLPEGVKLKSVTSFSLRDGEIIALVTLQHGPGLVTSMDDMALVRLTGVSQGTLLLREGATFSGSSIKTISALKPARLSPGHGRWQTDGGEVAKVTLSNGDVMLARLNADGTTTPLLTKAYTLEGRHLTGIGLPAAGSAGNHFAVRTTSKLTGAKDDEAALLYSPDGLDWHVLAREGAAAPGSGTFSRFSDPVINAGGEVAFMANRIGTGFASFHGQQLLSKHPERDVVDLLASRGSPAAGADGQPMIAGPKGEETAAVWTEFTSFALPSGESAGAVFIAKLGGAAYGIGKDDVGLWAVDYGRTVRLLLRTGDAVIVGDAEKTVASFRLLESLPGTFGATRSYNATGSLALVATFTDGTQALLRIDIP